MDHVRHALTVLLALAGTAGAKNRISATAEVPDADAKEAKAAREQGTVLHDGKGHYIVLATASPDFIKSDGDRAVFYGDGTTFYRVTIKAFGTNAKQDDLSADWSILDVRLGLALDNSNLRLHDNVFTMMCREEATKTTMTRLPPDEARALLAKATFKTHRMDRVAYALGRDGTTYYYADASSRTEPLTDLRVYVGKRGALKPLKLTHTAADTKGVVFTSKTGTLRVTNKPLTLTWAPKPNRPISLTAIPVEANLELVYAELGVYAAKKFGLPCDDL